MMDADIRILFIFIACIALVAVVTYMAGVKHGTNAEKAKASKTKTDTARMLQSTYTNGIRVGKRQMLDQLVDMHKLDEVTAEAISEDI